MGNWRRFWRRIRCDGFAEPDVAVVAEAVGVGHAHQVEIEVAQRPEGPAEQAVGEDAPPAPGQQHFGEFDGEDKHGGRRACAPAGLDDFERAGHGAQAFGGEAAVVAGVGVEGVAEGGDGMRPAAGGEDAFDFAHDALGVDDVFEHGIALDAGELGVAEGEQVGVGLDVDAGGGVDVEVDVAVDVAVGAADVEVPLAERSGGVGFAGVADEGVGRGEERGEAASGFHWAGWDVEDDGLSGKRLGRGRQVRVRGMGLMTYPILAIFP